MKFDSDFNRLMAVLETGLPKYMELEGFGDSLNPDVFTEAYMGASTTADASADPNSNVSEKNVIGYSFEMPKAYTKVYSMYVLWKKLNELYGKEIANSAIEKHITGDIYIHDLHSISSFKPYCFNFSTYDVMLKGLPMINKIKSVRPKHLYSFKSQIEQFSIIAGNTIAGAVGLADFLIVSSYYIENALDSLEDAHFKFRTEEDVWEYIKETFYSFIYTMNQPTRASQSIFSNLSVYDDVNLKELQQDYIFPGGRLLNIPLVRKIQHVFLECMNNTLKRTPLTFPVITACVAIDENNNILDESFIKEIAELNQEFGFINIFNGRTSTLSSCCRLRSETSHEFFNSFGAGKSKIGSIGVVTLNLPRYAYEAKRFNETNEAFIGKVRNNFKLAGKINHAKRMIVKDAIDAGIHPLYTYEFMDLNKQYSTTGVNGLYEAIEALGMNIIEPEGMNFAIDLMEKLNSWINSSEKTYGYPMNCEQIPAESMAVKAAKKDWMAGYQDSYKLYSNQFIPLTAHTDVLNRIYLQGKLDKHFSGGSVLHLNIGQPLSVESTVKLIKICAKQGVAYWAANYVLKECTDGHLTAGRGDTCDICAKPIINEYTRVVGFLVNTKNFSKERREHDYPKREWYKTKEVVV